MVKGLDIFTKWFELYSDQYVLIGGTAASISMNELGLSFRGTRDLDVVLHIEALTPEFGRVFWKFIDAGRYQTQETNQGSSKLYRFKNPQEEEFPFMVELFSRVPDGIDIPKDSHLTPIPIDEEVSSLSAILLDDDYYQFVISGRKAKNGFVSWVAEDRLIPLKAIAWLDMTERKRAGESIDSNKIDKHQKDIVVLSGLLNQETRIDVPPKIATDLKRFIDEVSLRNIPNFDTIKERLFLAYGLA